MASIINDKTTKGKYLLRAIDNNGDDVEVFYDTLYEAQVGANLETQNQIRYFDEWVVIDGLKQHPSGLNFREWLKSKNEK